MKVQSWFSELSGEIDNTFSILVNSAIKSSLGRNRTFSVNQNNLHVICIFLCELLANPGRKLSRPREYFVGRFKMHIFYHNLGCSRSAFSWARCDNVHIYTFEV